MDGCTNSPWEPASWTPSPRIFTATLDKSMIVDASDVEKIVGGAPGTLLDARAPQYFQGKLKADVVAAYGHIPGSISLDSERFYDPATNRLRPPTELAAIAAPDSINRPGCDLLQQRALVGDGLVRSVGIAGPQECDALLWLHDRMVVGAKPRGIVITHQVGRHQEILRPGIITPDPGSMTLGSREISARSSA